MDDDSFVDEYPNSTKSKITNIERLENSIFFLLTAFHNGRRLNTNLRQQTQSF